MPADSPTGRQLIALKNQIVSGFKQSHWRELGELTDTLEMVQGHHRLLRSLRFGDEDYEEHVLEMIKSIIAADHQNYALLCDYVARKCPEGGEFVSCDDNGARRIVFSPSVFRVPSEKPNTNLVSVMMPFGSQMDSVYEAIKAAASATGFDCRRADDIWDDSTVIQDVFALIFKSYIVVCDFTSKNPNVFYEAGIAHTLGKHVIPITQFAEDIPFDLRHHRYARYLNNSEGRDGLRKELENRLTVLRGKQSLANWS
ncbi:MAG: hypothetical protein ACK5EA_21045 [Planctomycetaceae bacterium]|jgi:hypothetical protein